MAKDELGGYLRMKRIISALLTGKGNNTLKDKNIIPVLGHPLLYWPAMAAKQCCAIDYFYVSSESDNILREAEKCGYKAIRRPESLSMPSSLHGDVISHALSEMAKDGVVPSILVVLLANSATIMSEWISESIDRIIEDPRISAVCPVEKNQDMHPFRAKKMRGDGFLEPFFDLYGHGVSSNRQDLCDCFFLCHNFWTLNLDRTLSGDEIGQPPWNFMGDHILPILVEGCVDVHDMDDVSKTEDWILKNVYSERDR